MKKLILITLLLVPLTANAGIAKFISDTLSGSKDCIYPPDGNGVYYCNNKKVHDFNYYKYKNGKIWRGCMGYPYIIKGRIREINSDNTCWVMLGGEE